MVAKAGLGLIGLGALGVGGAAIAKPEWFGISSAMPAYTTLASKATELNDKWVKDYRVYFVNSEGNDDWFDWVFRNRYNKNDANNKTKFVGLIGGKGSGTDKSLANACKLAYDADNGKIKTTDSEATGDNFLEENIWKYCSVGGAKLKLVKDDADKEKYKDKLGKQNETDLLSVDEKDNDWAWHLKQKKFLSDTEPGEQGVFKKFHQENNKHKTEDKGTRLRDKCKEQYGNTAKSEDNDQKITAEILKKYCSLKVDGPSA